MVLSCSKVIRLFWMRFGEHNESSRPNWLTSAAAAGLFLVKKKLEKDSFRQSKMLVLRSINALRNRLKVCGRNMGA